MADRLIYADKLKAHYAWWKGGTREMTMDEAKSDFDTIVDLQPTVDPTKHGRWMEDTLAFNGIALKVYRCTACGEPFWTNPAGYCPHCGARMDGGENG